MHKKLSHFLGPSNFFKLSKNDLTCKQLICDFLWASQTAH